MGVIVHQLRAGDWALVCALTLLTLPALGILAAGFLPLSNSLRRLCLLAWQMGAVLGLEQAYELMRGAIPHDGDVALLNAYRLLDFEWQHGLFVEQRIEQFFLQFRALMTAIDLFYIVAHVGVTLGVVAWVYVRRRPHFGFVRNLLMLTTALALIAFYLYPTAPPRLLGNYGFVDPAMLNGLVPQGGAQPGSYTYNPYAAMPSLHVAYALVVAVALLRVERARLVQVLAALYPFLMAATVIISGNHWVLDVVGAAVTVALALLLLSAGRHVSSRLTASAPRLSSRGGAS